VPKKKEKMVDIDIEFDKELLYKGLLVAHELDITFNQFVQKALESYIKKYEKPSGGGSHVKPSRDLR
jgi:hypothetical protein